MDIKNPWKGPVEDMPSGGEFTHDGEVAIRVVAIGADWQDYQYNPVVAVRAGDNVDNLRTKVIEWILDHSAESLPGVNSVEYTVMMIAETGEALPQEEEFGGDASFDAGESSESNA